MGRKPVLARPMPNLSKQVRFAYRKPERKDAVLEKFIFFFIDMQATSRSGFLLDKEDRRWSVPEFTVNYESAYVMEADPRDIQDFVLYAQNYVGGMFYIVPLSYNEVKRWHGCDPKRKGNNRYDTSNSPFGEIKYY